MSATPTISVCIANYNGESLLCDCLDSVLSQQVGAAVEIIVHDDASQDRSLELLTSRYPGVHVITSAENVGFCIANNRMVNAANGDYVLLLNNDAALGDGALAALLSEARRIGGNAILTLPQYDWETGALVDRGCLLDPFYNPVPNLDEDRADVAYVIGACLWVQRALWDSLGGFPEWIGSIGEDMYLCCLTRLRGFAVRVAGGSNYRHRQGASFGGNRVQNGLRSTYRRRALSERNKTSVMVLCTPGVVTWPLLALHCALLVAEGLLLVLLHGSLRPWREVYGAALTSQMRNWPKLRALRREIQQTRRASIRDYLGAFTWMPRKLSLLHRYGVPRMD